MLLLILLKKDDVGNDYEISYAQYMEFIDAFSVVDRALGCVFYIGLQRTKYRTVDISQSLCRKR